MNYHAQLTGKVPKNSTEIFNTGELDLTHAAVINPANTTIQKLNLLYIDKVGVDSVDTRSVYALNMIDITPIMYKSSNPANEYDYDANNTVSATYSTHKKISERHIPYLHGELIGAGKIPFARYETTSTSPPPNNDNNSVVSTANADYLINGIGRILTIDNGNVLRLLGYEIDNGALKIAQLSAYTLSTEIQDLTSTFGYSYPVNN